MTEKKEEKKEEKKVEVEDLEADGEDVKGGANAAARQAIKKDRSTLKINTDRINERIKR